MKPLSTCSAFSLWLNKGARDCVHLMGLLLSDVFQSSHEYEDSAILPSLPFFLISPFKLFYSRGFDAEMTDRSIIPQSPEVFYFSISVL